MSNPVIKVENISKQYRLGMVGRKSISHDVHRWWHRIRGKEDPYLKIGQENNRAQRKSSDYVWALRDIQFDLQQGEILGIIGRNGAGKSTLLKILAKVTAPTQGEIKIRGKVAALLEVGTGFHPELSGRDNIFLNGAILGMTRKEIRRKFDEIVDFAGVEKYIDTPVKRYSSGMYVRLAFAVAAHLEPDILIVDEVLAVGDAEFQKKCLGKMQDVSRQEGRTVLFVSHNLPSIMNLCDQVLVLEWGKKIYHGATAAGIDTYLHRNKQIEENDLTKRTDRKGNGKIRCTNIRMENAQGNPIEVVKSGDDLVLKIFFEVRQPVSEIIYFRLQVMDMHEQMLFLCNNHHVGFICKPHEGKGEISCVIPHLPLFGGDYYLNLLIYSQNQETFDALDYAYSLQVVDGDFFGTGVIPQNRKGMLIQYYWQ